MITVNKNTTQTPLTSRGRTGDQSVRFIPAPRVYVAAPDYSPVPGVIFPVSNGSTPAGFTDLGVVTGNAAVGVSRATNPVYSGVDRLLAGVYTQGVSADIGFTLSQCDDFALEQVSGTVPNSSVQGVYANYLLGKQNITPMALLLVIQNKLDGKEWQFYNPAALMSFAFDYSGDSMALRVSSALPAFTNPYTTAKQLLAITLLTWANGGYGITPYGISYGY